MVIDIFKHEIEEFLLCLLQFLEDGSSCIDILFYFLLKVLFIFVILFAHSFFVYSPGDKGFNKFSYFFFNFVCDKRVHSSLDKLVVLASVLDYSFHFSFFLDVCNNFVTFQLYFIEEVLHSIAFVMNYSG